MGVGRPGVVTTVGRGLEAPSIPGPEVGGEAIPGGAGERKAVQVQKLGINSPDPGGMGNSGGGQHCTVHVRALPHAFTREQE